MTEYQRTGKNPYKLPQFIYMQVIYIIQDYERLLQEHKTARPEVAAAMLRYIEGVEQGALCARAEYADRLGDDFDPLRAFANQAYFAELYAEHRDSGKAPAVRTWRTYRAAVVYHVAVWLKMAD